jgi:hypothetical protein
MVQVKDEFVGVVRISALCRGMKHGILSTNDKEIVD